MLGMYDLPAIRTANDRFWSLIRTRLGFGPGHLTRDTDPWEIWQSPDLLIAQTCGMPFRTRLHPHVTLIGTPDYDLPGCPPGYYNSVLVARADATGTVETDFANGVFAYNDALSQSGWAAPMSHLNALGIRVPAVLQTGAHVSSARAVAEGRADLAGLDAMTWTLLQQHDPVARRLKVIATTAPTPGLPLITAAARDPAPLAAAVRTAIRDLSVQDRDLLKLKALIDIPKSAYLAVTNPPGP